MASSEGQVSDGHLRTHSAGPAPADVAPPRLLFVNGFHRSGTTVMTSAVTEAVGGITTTVGLLARHIPTLDAFLQALPAGTVDRGADRLEVTPQTAEEYGFLLNHRTGTHALYGHPDGVPLLREHIANLAAEAPHATIVLKNPWEVGHESQLLADYPDARIILLRRRLADIERSIDKALPRAGSSRLPSAPWTSDSEQLERPPGIPVEAVAAALGAAAGAAPAGVHGWPAACGSSRPTASRSCRSTSCASDPQAGAAWAAHLLDPTGVGGGVHPARVRGAGRTGAVLDGATGPRPAVGARLGAGVRRRRTRASWLLLPRVGCRMLINALAHLCGPSRPTVQRASSSAIAPPLKHPVALPARTATPESGQRSSIRLDERTSPRLHGRRARSNGCCLTVRAPAA